MDILEKLSLAGLVPVIAINDADDAVPLCKALADGGLPVAEITFRTAAAEESIRRVHEELPEVILCAGTVLTTDQAERAVKAGAAAIVSPGLNPRSSSGASTTTSRSAPARPIPRISRSRSPSGSRP